MRWEKGKLWGEPAQKVISSSGKCDNCDSGGSIEPDQLIGSVYTSTLSDPAVWQKWSFRKLVVAQYISIYKYIHIYIYIYLFKNIYS